MRADFAGTGGTRLDRMPHEMGDPHRRCEAMAAKQGRAETGSASPGRPDEGQASRDAAFRRAASHSRKVQFLKFALPVGAIAIAGSFAAYSYLSVPGSVSFDVSESAYVDGKLVMANPKLDGYTKDSRPYWMTATRALQHVKDSSIIELEGIDAKLPVGGENFAAIGAERGVYNYDKSTLEIPSPITIKTTDGMTATLQSASVDIGKGNLSTKDPVSINLDGVKLSADAMRVLQNGKVLIFEKRVRMELEPERIKAKPDTEKDGAKSAED
jgi:lipopolysaccharide export system protein LptC